MTGLPDDFRTGIVRRARNPEENGGLGWGMRRIEKLYGLWPSRLHEILRLQNWECAICRRSFREMSQRLRHIDHDHLTGVVRGVLCHHCNTMLGLALDNPEILRRAFEYLNEK